MLFMPPPGMIFNEKQKLNLRHQSSASANPKSNPSLYPVTVEHVESQWKLNAAKPAKRFAYLLM